MTTSTMMMVAPRCVSKKTRCFFRRHFSPTLRRGGDDNWANFARRRRASCASLSLDPSRRSEAVFILRTMFVTTRQRRFLSGKRQNTLSPKGIIKSSLLSKGVEEEIEDRDNNFLLLFFFVLCVMCLQHESPYERQKKAKRWGGGGKKKDQKKRSTYKRGKRKKRDHRLKYYVFRV